MVASIALRGAFAAITVGIIYQWYLRDLVQLVGYGRQMKTLADFPFHCRRINEPNFEACEDMWYDDKAKQIYLACSTVAARRTWTPNVGLLRAPSSDEGERVVVIDVEKPKGDSFHHRVLKVKKLKTPLHVLSITGQRVASSGKINFYLINNKPTVDAKTGLPVDNRNTGADVTIEVFEHTPGTDDLVHLRTFSHELISTPNNVAVDQDGGIYLTNDHGQHKTGILAQVSLFTFSGAIVHCKADTPTDCAVVSTQHSFPNGILIPDSYPNLLFAASAGLGGAISIYDINPPSARSLGHPILKLRQKVKLDQGIDNLTWEPKTKSVYAAGIPDMLGAVGNILNATCDHQVSAAGSVIRLFEEKNLVDGARWVAETVLEDPHGLVLPGVTAALRDGNGAVWTSGILSPFITICEPANVRH